MSQSGYNYQSYADYASNQTKNNLPPMVNGQMNAIQQVQNGAQTPQYNLTGTPSSQSSRDPSRETSRDPSPTQYLHTQYRPQLNRPLLPPINGQQSSNSNYPPSISIPQQQQNPTLTSQNIQNQYSTNVPTSNVISHSIASTNLQKSDFIPQKPQINHSNANRTVTSLENQITPNIAKTIISTSNTHKEAISSAPFNNPTLEINQTQNHLQPSHSRNVNLNTNTSISSTLSGNNNSSQFPHSNQVPPKSIPTYTTAAQKTSQSIEYASSASSPSGMQHTQPTQNVNQNVNRNNLPLQSIPSSANQVRNQTQGATLDGQFSNPIGPQTVPTYRPSQMPYESQQNLFNNTPSTQNNSQTVPHQYGQNTTYNSQNIFANNQHGQFPTQNLSGPRNIPPTVQNQYPSAQQVQYSSQAVDPLNIVPSPPSQSLRYPPPPPRQEYSKQPNLASQKKYPQIPYGAQLPPTTANVTNPTVMSQQSPLSPNPSGEQYQAKSLSGLPPLPGQQMQNQYNPQPSYHGQMSNVPLDNIAKRYPGTYPEQMNQLNNQMSGMTVTQAGFNKLWGAESIDLLQCRNILPAEKVEPPLINLNNEYLDNVNCSPDIFRCTLTKIPESNSLLQKSRLPLGVLIHPFKDLNLPVIQCSTIVRCRFCRTYINPFISFVDSKRWKCNICYRVNDLPEEFQFDPVTKSYGDPSRRPEVKTSTIEFIAPSEYMLRPPQPAVYLFILDVSRLAVESGYLNVVCNILSEELFRLPGDSRTQIGFLAVDSAVHFFSMPDNVSQPHEMIMLDVDDVFLPCPDNLIVNLKEKEELVKDLLSQLPTKFQGTHDTNNALGAGLQAAHKLISLTGGRITVFQTCLPNLGPGMLQPREDPNSRANKDVPHLNPANDFYKRLALDCSGQQIAVDLFLLNSQYCDLATLSGMCKFSGGCMYHLPLFRASKLPCVELLEKMLRRYLTRKIGFEAVMRVRCTRGLSIHTFHGNFFVRSTDLLSLPNVNPDAGFGMQISIEENLSDVQNVCFQAALLYTSSKGERKIRVHTLCLPVASNMSDILHSADQQCIIGLLSKMAVDRSQQSSLSDARDALINAGIDVLSAYKLTQSLGSSGLLAPGNLKLLPLYIIALLKCVAFRTGTSTRLDDRVFAMCQLKSLPLSQLIQMVYPDLYPIHALDDRNSREVEGKLCPQAPRLHLSAEKLDSRGVFLLNAGDKIYIYVGKNVHPSYCSNVFGVPAFAAIPEELYDLPEIDTAESERLRNFIFSLQEEKPYYASVQIIRDDSHFRTLFTERLIEDRIESALSYYEFIQHLKTQVK